MRFRIKYYKMFNGIERYTPQQRGILFWVNMWDYSVDSEAVFDTEEDAQEFIDSYIRKVSFREQLEKGRKVVKRGVKCYQPK